MPVLLSNSTDPPATAQGDAEPAVEGFNAFEAVILGLTIGTVAALLLLGIGALVLWVLL